MVKPRSPMQVDEEFEKRVKNLKMKFQMKTGKEISMREITRKIAKQIDDDRILGLEDTINFKIKFDRRIL